MTFKELIKQLLLKLCCLHDYEKVWRNNVYISAGDTLPYKIKFLYKCKKCGKFKQVTIE